TTSLQNIETEAVDINQRQQGRQEIAEQTQQQLLTAQAQEMALRVELAKLEGLLSAREQEKRSLREHYTDCRVRVASLQKQRERYDDDQKRCQRERDHLQSRRQQKENETQLTQSKRKELEDQLVVEKEKVNELQISRHLLVRGLAERETVLKTMATQFREDAEHLRQLEKSLTGLERKQARLDVERDRVEGDLQTILDRLRDSWELDFDAAEQLAKPVQNKKIAQEAIRQLKERLNQLGTVNLGAIDEHQRVSERVDFLITQRDDLRVGEKDLLRIIHEIDSRMGEKFTTAFATINENFGMVFKELFGGGRAQLRLTDPDNPLDAGVEIVAQPPGKKLQHMSLLSGGEKALTAISLLFAFLKLRPSPFCILDEIEAALDEANLNRFSDYLRTFSEETQFILITHRKRTMEQADILYGVTMEESGVSKLISVRLRDSSRPIPTVSA
ncbi:MAG: chromosome segregation protein SMC, partial [Firmicutes bacterium]|nr:chromosome segregation protein SMC [Bacillota bacterium]